MKHFKYLLLLLAISFIAGACHKDPPKTYDDTDMTITYFNPEFDYNTYTTFIMPDSAVLKTNYLTESEVDNFYKNDGTSEKVLELLKNSFLSMGYTEVDTITEADFIALPTILMTESDDIVYYGTGWWWGYPGYGWGYGWYKKSTNYYYGWYPYYPWYPTAIPVSISTYVGTVVYEMLDAASYLEVVEWNENNPDPGPDDVSPQLKINWQAQIEGYSTDDGSYNQERAQRGTDEALAQSPYLYK